MSLVRTRKTLRVPLRRICSGECIVNHRVGRLVFAAAVGLLAAYYAYEWVTNAGPNLQRQQEESAVAEARGQLQELLGLGAITIVDPLLPDRKVGKTYVYAAGDGWEVSGYYRRNEHDLWHPYLATMRHDYEISHLKVSDSALLHRDGEGVLEVLP